MQKYSTFHPRCGTSFLMTVMLISIGFYMLVPFTTFWARFASRIALLPVIAGVSYEIIRFAAKHRGSLFALMTAPGLWLQRITTQASVRRAGAVRHSRPRPRHGAGKRTRRRVGDCLAAPPRIFPSSHPISLKCRKRTDTARGSETIATLRLL